MKIRIKGHSIRFRLSKTEVHSLCKKGAVWSETAFGQGKPVFRYGLVVSSSAEQMHATFGQSSICIYIPQSSVVNWESNEQVGFEHLQKNDPAMGLHLLVEKDFQCTIERVGEEEGDLYENPQAKLKK